AAEHSVRSIIQPCEWYAELHRANSGGKLAVWPVGIDVARYADSTNHSKPIDVLIYDKIRWNLEETRQRVVWPLIERLEARGLTYKVLLYGLHRHRDYTEFLKRSRS